MTDYHPRRPMLRWHGGKWRMAAWIMQHMPKHRVYVEPFAGAASVLLQKPRVHAEYLNDLDGDLVNLFQVLRDDLQSRRLIHLLTLTPFARAEFTDSYNPTDDPVERARRLCVRSFMGFGSASGNSQYKTGFRCKSFRSNTGPATDWRNYPIALTAIIDRLRGVTIESRPALKMVAALDTLDTLFYVDPPYPASTRANFGAYRHEMTDEQHEEMAVGLKDCTGYVLLSGYRCDLYDHLFAGWARTEKRSMSDKGWRTECLWLSPRASAALQYQSRGVQQSLLEVGA